MRDPLSILCVDDDPRLRAALERLIAQQRDMRVVPGRDRAEGLGEVIEAHRVDVVLLDLHMPGPDPLEVLRGLTRAGCAARVIVLSGADVREHEARAMDAGAWALLNKATDPCDVLQAIRRVAAGEVVLPE